VGDCNAHGFFFSAVHHLYEAVGTRHGLEFSAVELGVAGKETEMSRSESRGKRDNPYVVRPYTSADNAALAVMWNESDDQWPGTFTRGVPLTEARVRDWMDRETCLMRLVVEETAGGAIVGYGSLWETPGRDDCCYVSVFNVHPAHQKRSLARRMLTQMVDWATENGRRRMTIGTWPANLKSVPLYKKTGFFWIPGTGVHMENYVPLVRGLPAARGFFERHDWYATFHRELEQVEDDQRHPLTGEIKVYVYRWEADGEFVEAVVDRQAQALTGLATTRFSAYAVVDEGEPAQGLVYPVRWRVANRRDEPVQVSLLADGSRGIELRHRDSFRLAGGKERVVEASFTCNVDAPRLDLGEHEDRPAPCIRTTLVVGGEVVELATGLRYRPAVEIGVEPAIPSLLPGRQRTICLQLHNRTNRPLRGSVSLTPQVGLATDWMRREFELEPGGRAGLPLKVTCERAASTPLWAMATFRNGDHTVSVTPRRIQLLVTPPGGVCADRDEIENRVVVENDFFQVICRARGGRCDVRSKALRQSEVWLGEEVGPPFTPHELGDREYDLALDHGEGWARVSLIAGSGRFAGVRLCREITVTASPLITVRYRAVNEGRTAHAVQVRPGLGISRYEEARVALPREERLVAERAVEFPTLDGDVPKKPEGLAEQWIAYDRGGQTAGVIWDGDVVEHEAWGSFVMLFFAEWALESQGAAAAGPFYLYVGPGDWRDVRRAWQRAAGVVTQHADVLPEPERPHAFGLSPSPLVALGGEVEARLSVDTVRERKLAGRVVVEPPPGWTVDRAEFPVEGVRDSESLEQTVRLAASGDGVGASEGRLLLETELFDEVRPFALIRLGDESAPVHVEEGEEAGQTVWTISNGCCTWTIAPSYHAGVVAWLEPGEDVNHLLTPFPENGELGVVKPWFGGIWPTVVPMDVEYNGWPGKLHEESFAPAPLELIDANGIAWQGVQVVASVTSEGFEGLRAEVAYLTVGGSNVLKVVFRLVNETTAYRRAKPGLIAFLQVDGRHEDGVLHGEDIEYRRTPRTKWPHAGVWGAVVDPAGGRAVVLVDASGRRRVQLADWGNDGGHLYVGDESVLAPRGSGELAAYLALAGSLEEARLYRAMGNGQ
jgi:GNAT superfamily N-acetyltransferase